MTVRPAFAALFLAPLALSACERKAAEPPARARVSASTATPAPPPAWFICDAVNAPTVLVVGRPDAERMVTILAIDKADMHPPAAVRYALGEDDPGAGSVTRTLTRDGLEVGYIKNVSPGMLPKPEEATTTPFLTVKLDEAVLACRWLARTRLFGVAAGRTVLVADGKDGPLLRTYDFKAAAGVAPIEPDGAQRTTAPSLRIAAGKVDGGRYTFANAGYGYVVDTGGVAVTQNGEATSDEPFIAVQTAN